MSAILSTGLNASFAGRVFGFGAVTARAYTGDLRFNNLPDPDLILACLEHRRQSCKRQRVRNRQNAFHVETLALKGRVSPARSGEPEWGLTSIYMERFYDCWPNSWLAQDRRWHIHNVPHHWWCC